MKKGMVKVIKNALLVILKILCFVLCILGTAFLLKNHSVAYIAIKEPATAEHFEMLEKNAMMLAETLNPNYLEDEIIAEDIGFETEKLVVTVKSIKAQVTVKIPIVYSEYGMDNGNFRIQGSLELNNRECERINQLMPGWYYIIVAWALSALLSYALYMILALALILAEWIWQKIQAIRNKH